jgi:glycosyltransferase involved in cell wall biosynthesis
MSKPLVTVITATTGSQLLKQNLASIKEQTYKNIQHLVVVDGIQHEKNVKRFTINQDILVLPYPTGIEQYNGHRIYGGCTYFAKGDFITYLDEDNWAEPNHIESLVDCINADKNKWAYSLRKIVDQSGKFICNDDCENLGKWKSVLNDNFVDVNCYFFPRTIALQLSPLWYRRARHPDDQPEVDRIISHTLFSNKIECETNGRYTINYRAGNRADSVQLDFFKRGNDASFQRYNGYPWRRNDS